MCRDLESWGLRQPTCTRKQRDPGRTPLDGLIQASRPLAPVVQRGDSQSLGCAELGACLALAARPKVGGTGSQGVTGALPPVPVPPFLDSRLRAPGLASWCQDLTQDVAASAGLRGQTKRADNHGGCRRVGKMGNGLEASVQDRHEGDLGFGDHVDQANLDATHVTGVVDQADLEPLGLGGHVDQADAQSLGTD